ncbi:hypothetical protein PI124_g10735 [Phytophthora idaei]|nr:hypothetical protein PI126_g9605 [Phytophthora idaei]KAG3244491.1 hypothetical protein PI124_g10735 [Phytophthora idaei]
MAQVEFERNLQKNLSLQSANEKHHLKMKLITTDTCYEVIRAAYGDVCSFRTSRDFYTSNAEVLGWTHRYRLEGENCNTPFVNSFRDAQRTRSLIEVGLS